MQRNGFQIKYITAILGALLVFAVVGGVTLFIGMRLVEEAPMVIQALIIGLCVMIGALAAYFSFRASIRR